MGGVRPSPTRTTTQYYSWYHYRDSPFGFASVEEVQMAKKSKNELHIFSCDLEASVQSAIHGVWEWDLHINHTHKKKQKNMAYYIFKKGMIISLIAKKKKKIVFLYDLYLNAP